MRRGRMVDALFATLVRFQEAGRGREWITDERGPAPRLERAGRRRSRGGRRGLRDERDGATSAPAAGRNTRAGHTRARK